ncbi:MAG: SDR family oxidoreductase [Solirubrobacterales bacterium]
MSSSEDLFSVRGRRVLVTGGSGGIGLMLARGFAAAGAEVIVSSRDAEACEAAAAEIGGVAVPADVGTDAGVATLVEAVGDRWGGLEVLINNAGVAWGAPLDEYPVEAFDKQWRVNVRGAFALTQGLLAPLRASAREGALARVINIGSVDGMRVPFFDNFGYSATKAAVHMLTRHLAEALATDGITVNAIASGPFRSKMMRSVLDDERTGPEILARIPLGRLGASADVAGLAIFLASPAASWLTGAVIPLDGGLSLRS